MAWKQPQKQSLWRPCNVTDASCASAYAGFFGPVHIVCKTADRAVSEADVLCNFEVLLAEAGLSLPGGREEKLNARWGLTCLCPGFLAWDYKTCACVSFHAHAQNAMGWSAMLPSLYCLCPTVVLPGKLSSNASWWAWDAWKTCTLSTPSGMGVRHGGMHHCWGALRGHQLFWLPMSFIIQKIF